MKKKNVLKPSTLDWNPEWTLEVVGISQSLLCDWLTCRRKFLFKINGYGQPLKEEKVHFGNIVHDVNDKVYSKGVKPSSRKIGKLIDNYTHNRITAGTMLTQEQMETDAAKAHATLIPYFETYKLDFTKKKFTDVEHVFKIKYNGATIRGKIDGGYLANRKKWKMEHKTKGQINENTILLRLPLDFQNLTYLLADEIETGKLAMGTLYNVIRNTTSKPHKGESIKSYFKRILETCQGNPDHFYKRWESVYTSVDHELFRKDLGHILHDLKHRTGLPVYCNRFSCDSPWPCEFLRACSEDSMQTLSTSKEPIGEFLFPELKEETNASEKSTSRKAEKRVAKRKVAKRKVATRKKS